MFHYVAVDDAGLSGGGTVKRSSSVLTPSHDCLCTKAIVVIEYVGLTFRGRLSLASSRCSSDSFLRRCAFYTFTRSHARGQKTTHQIPTSIRDASFGCLFYALYGHDASLDEWHGAAQQTSEQTA